jgi:hypothetical protein
MRSSQVVGASESDSDSQCKRCSPKYNVSILWHIGILGAADEAALNTEYKKNQQQKSVYYMYNNIIST